MVALSKYGQPNVLALAQLPFPPARRHSQVSKGTGIRAVVALAAGAAGREPLHYAEALELTRDRPKRCPICAVKVLKRPKFLSLADVYKPWTSMATEEDSSCLSGFVAAFLRDRPRQWAALLRPEYHTWHSSTKRFHKELSESLALLAAFATFASAGSSLDSWISWHALDLCCGKSLTSALLALEEAPPEAITAVDLRPPDGLPHHELALQRALQAQKGRAYAKVPVEYWRSDVLEDDFVSSLARRVEAIGRPTAILAMHLCGRLRACRPSMPSPAST
ncbi:unnamed protein product [Symbiodinium natans]|uniref:Uncharacterized protein n=1 Tax=Symbiodinium natans TaxID=878477 RepID=A0A812TT48_9DINO|nr:unnamed protein product [Symbiodinium natans]